jgi:hypothetical protein
MSLGTGACPLDRIDEPAPETWMWAVDSMRGLPLTQGQKTKCRVLLSTKARTGSRVCLMVVRKDGISHIESYPFRVQGRNLSDFLQGT